MPITRSAKKALRQSIRKRQQNLQKKEAYKNAVKKIKNLVAAGKIDEAKTIIPSAYKALDKAAKTGVIKKNAASRIKSRLMRLFRPKKQ
jgi:small subunit ribosomal protein S20